MAKNHDIIKLCDNNEPFAITGVTFHTILGVNWDKYVSKPIPLNRYIIMLCYHICIIPITSKNLVNCIMSHVYK